jgi:hypothetical protein
MHAAYAMVMGAHALAATVFRTAEDSTTVAVCALATVVHALAATVFPSAGWCTTSAACVVAKATLVRCSFVLPSCIYRVEAEYLKLHTIKTIRRFQIWVEFWSEQTVLPDQDGWF